MPLEPSLLAGQGERMTTSADARPSGVRRRRRSLLLVGLLLMALALAGTILWLVRRPAATLVPPPVPKDQAEPEVTAFIEKSRERVLKEPRSGPSWGNLGQVFLANDMEEESLVCFAEAERLDPSNPRWPYYQGGIWLNRGQQEAALPYLERAAERGAVADPENQVPRLFLGETLLTLGRVEDAEDQFRQVQARQPGDPRVHFDLALAASARQDWRTSRDHLLRCRNSPSARQKASVQLAGVYQRLGEPAEAEKYRQLAQRLPPDGDWSDPYLTEELRWAVKKKSRYRLSESLEAAGQIREAAAVLQPLVEQYPDDYLPRLALGKLLAQLGEYRRAESLLRETLHLSPDKVQAHYYLSLVLYSQAEDVRKRGGDRDRADSLYRQAMEAARQTLAVKPDYGFAYMPLGLSLKRLGQRPAALDALRKAVHRNPEYAELHFYLGEMLAEDGLRSEAREQLEQAVQMAPPNADWRPTALALVAAMRSDSDK